MGEKIRKTHSSDPYDIANYFEIGKELLFIALLGKGKTRCLLHYTGRRFW